MFKVECPGCKAPYQVDERRVPSTGLKMRCPKCGTSFQVEPPDDGRRTGPSPVLGDPAAPRPDPGAARSQLRNPAARTMVGVAPSSLGLPPAGAKPAAPTVPARPEPPKAAPARPPVPARPAAPKAPDPYADADLPAVGGKEADLPVAAPARKPPPIPGGARPAPPVAKPAAAKPPSTLPPEDLEEEDLPAVPGDELDLPAPVAPPPARAPRAPAPPVDVDLPAIATDSEWGLPAVSGGKAPPAAARPAAQPSSSGLDLDLPDLPGLELGGEPESPGLGDLPSLGSRRAAPTEDLSGRVRADLPSPSADLPTFTAGLPSPAAGLPAVAAAGLPALGGAGLPSPAAGLPVRAAPPTAPPSQGFGELDLDLTPGPAPGAIDLGMGGPGSLPPGPASFGEIELPPGPGVPSARPAAMPSGRPPAAPIDPLEADPFGEAPIPSQRPAPATAAASATSNITRAEGGGTSYGEVNLDGGGGAEVPLDAPIRSPAANASEEMEFGAVPAQAPAPAAAAAPTRMPSHAPKRRSRWPLRVFGGLLVLAVGGGSLSFVPGAGPYGAYWISDRVNAGKHAALLADAQTRARKAFGRDLWPDAVVAVQDLEVARAGAKRYRPFAAYGAFASYLRELRFGSDPAVHARAKGLLAELGDARDVPYEPLAAAARDALEGQLSRADQSARALSRDRANDPDVLALLGEIELRGAEPGGARATFEALDKIETSARASFGTARAALAAGDTVAASAAAKITLSRTPRHVGARILLARIGARARATEPASLAELQALLKSPATASPQELVAAETLLGDIHLGRSHVALAEAAYTRALKIEPGAAPALRGLGEAQFRGGRFSEALARFEASLQADPESVASQVGVAKSKLSLDRIEDAAKILRQLVKTAPKDATVAYWLGRTLEASGDKDRASATYHVAIEKAPPTPAVVDVYVALAILQNERGQAEQAQKTLTEARKKLPESSALHRALGDLAILQARYAEAVQEFRRALELDADDLAARFRLGVALRRSQNYTAATDVLDQVAKVDPEHPGLALERGLIFEATGHGTEALKAYDAALAKAPTDPELMLRAGCGSVSAGQAERGEELLRKVLAQRPNSAEVNHCLGRSLLVRDKVADAQRLLDRAVELDPNRAEYHLYSGWAANEAGNATKADRELARALELDGSLTDAYWQRGVLRARQARVKDAIVDLTKALSLNPSRSEARAALADAYYDLGRERDALIEWERAVKEQPDNPVWHFRYGKLLVTNQLNDAGKEHLAKAIAAGEKAESPPRWLWEAHHFMARALAGRAEAAVHWEHFLRLGPKDSPYRNEAKQALARLGKPWTGD
jgi:cellulose synthase operon protein C